MFTEHYRKNNIFISSLSKVANQKIFFPFLKILGGKKLKKQNGRSKKIFCFARRRNEVESLVLLGLPRARMRMVSVGDTTRAAREN